MANKRRRRYEEEAVALDEVLEPYEQQPYYEEAETVYDDETQQELFYESYADEYSEEHELADMESRFRLAVGMLDLISIVVGIVVILVLVAMLVTLFQWLQDDILHSALLMQSGLQ
ncbi:MAG: hypothetical protein IJ354_04835 [Clostridia bacterium]|nr:hypothetical protein [Clostridia bacterium]